MSTIRFFIIGAPKCGTTTLYDWLGDHQAIHAPLKEACFFSQDVYPTADLRTHISTLDDYLAIYRPPSPKIKATGEATPKYLYSDAALASIQNLWPDARIIVCLRDPVDMIVSYYNQKLREGVEAAPNFEEAWRRSPYSSLRSDEIGPPEINGKINYVFWAHIGKRLEKWLAAFPREQFLIILMQDLKVAPREIYQKLLNFIAVPDDGRTDFKASNESRRVANVAFHRFVRNLKAAAVPITLPLHQLRGGRGLGVLKLIDSLNMEPGAYTSAASIDLRAEMYQRLADDISAAERFLFGRALVSVKAKQASR